MTTEKFRLRLDYLVQLNQYSKFSDYSSGPLVHLLVLVQRVQLRLAGSLIGCDLYFNEILLL